MDSANPPRFCYVVTVQDGSSVTPWECVTAVRYRPVLCRTLKSILQSSANAPVRVSAWCRLLHVHGHATEQTADVSSRASAPGFSLFVTDASLQQASNQIERGEDYVTGASSACYAKIEVLSSSVLPEGFWRDHADLLFLKDLRVTTKGSLRSSLLFNLLQGMLRCHC